MSRSNYSWAKSVNQQVAGLNPGGCKAFSLFPSSQQCALEQVSSGGAMVTIIT